MSRKSRFLNSFLSVILILSLTLMNVNVALADEGPTPEPTASVEPTEEPVQPTAEPTEPPVVDPTEPPVIVTAPPVVDIPIATEIAPTEQAQVIEAQAPITELLEQAPENTELVVLDENGEALALTSQEALNTILETDPMWCPAGVLPGEPGCTTNFGTILELITDMVDNTNTYDENGIIYFTASPNAPFSLTAATLGADYTTLNSFNLTLQGGWNGVNGAGATFTSQTNFSNNTLTIGTLGNPWIGNITLNNFSFSGVSSGAAVTVYTSSGNITLDNVDVLNQTNNTFTGTINSTSGNISVQNGSSFDGNSSNQSQGFSATTGTGSITISDTTFSESIRNGTGNTYDGATLSASTVTLNNVTATGSDGDGITINNASIVTLNNVTATNNGTASGAAGLAGNDGSGVFINGNAGSRVIIIGGTYTGNQEYGVEVASPANTTIYIQTNPTCSGNASNSPSPLGVNSCYNDTTVFDNTPPVITFVSRTPADVNGWNTSDVTVNWSCTDSGSGVVSAAISQIVSTEGTNQSATGTCQDLAGNIATNAQSNINIDKTAPTAIASVLPSANANGWNNTDVTVTFTGTDAGSGIVFCSSAVTISTEGAGQTSSAGTCTDLVGHVSSPVSASGINIDKTVPVIAFANMTPAPNANGWNNTDVSVNWSCTDGLSGPVSASVSQTVSTEGANQSATGTCQDLAGNAVSDNQSGINIDKTAPALNLPSDMTVEGSGLDGAAVNYSVTSTDNLDAVPIIDCSPASGSFFVVGTTMVNCTATDHADNTSFGNFNITVQDTTAPIIDPHGDVTAEATSASGANVSYSNPATSDIVDGPGVASCSPTSGSLFPLGNTPVTCTATDSHGNTATPTSFVVHVVDTTAPVIAAHADVFVAATSLLGAVVTYTNPGTSDIVDGSGSATCAPVSGSQFPVGSTTVSCNATDSHGNHALTTSFVVHVIDTAAPVIDGHLDVTVEATSAAGATATYTSPATTDAVDGTGVAICSPASGTFFGFGNTTVTCNATDSNGNAASPTSFVVHIVDTTAPVIAPHSDVTVTTSDAFGTIVSYSSPATSDAVDGAKTATCTPASGSFFAVGDTLVTCSATDAHGNTAQPVTFTVHVVHQPDTPTPAPTQTPATQPQENSLSIPVTSGLLDLDCLTVIDSFGIKITFHNLCDYQAVVTAAQTDTLPAQLPDSYSFVQGLNVLVLFEQQVVKALPTGTGVQLDFPVPANTQDEFAVLLWDDEDGDGNGEWLDVTQLIVDKDLSRVLSANPNDELYQIRPTKTLEALYRVVTTEKIGTFVLVNK